MAHIRSNSINTKAVKLTNQKFEFFSAKRNFVKFDSPVNPFMPELIFKINPILADLDKIAIAQRIMKLQTPEKVHSIENSKV